MMKPVIALPVALAAVLTLAAPLTVRAATFSFQTIDAPFAGAANSGAAGINNNGQIVGYYYDSNSPPLQERGFLYQGGTFTSLNDPNALPDSTGHSDTRAYGINDNGQIVGHYYDSSGVTHAFIRNASGSTWTTIDYPGAGTSGTVGRGIDGTGTTIVGYYGSGPYAYEYNTVTGTATALNDPSWGATASQAWGINNTDQIVGYYFNGSHNYGFLYNGSGYTTLSVPGANDTYARGINNNGWIVGNYHNLAGNHGFLYDGTNYYTLNDPNAGGLGTTVLGLNDAGQMVGYYYDGAGIKHGFLAAPVPLPDSLLLMGSGVIGLLGFTRRRARSHTRAA